MIFIHKNPEPKQFGKWKQKYPNRSYRNIFSNIHKVLRKNLAIEQGFICCFCGSAIGIHDKKKNDILQLYDKKSPHNIRKAHLIPQGKDRTKALSYSNLCASCNSGIAIHPQNIPQKGHCDVAQRDQLLPITPLQKDCLSFFTFYEDGKIGASPQKDDQDKQKASETINILQLNAPVLINRRRVALQNFMRRLSDNKQEHAHIFSKLTHKNKYGQHLPFYFILLSRFPKKINKIIENK